MADYEIEAWSLQKVGFSGALGEVTQIQGYSVTPGTTIQRVSASGDLEPTFAAMINQMAGLTFQTTDLVGAIDLINDATTNIAAIAIPTLVGDQVLEFFFVKKVQTAPGVYLIGGARKVTVNSGLVLLRGLTAQLGGTAMATIEVIVTQDETNDPLTVAGADEAIPATAQVTKVFGCGTCYINGDALEQVQSQAIDTGLNAQTVANAGQVGPAAAFIQGIRPSISLQTTAGRLITDFGFGGGVIAANTLFHFQRYTEGGGYAAPAATVHVKVEIFEGMLEIMPIQTQSSELILLGLTFHPTNDSVAGNAIMELSSDVAIVDPTA